MCACVSMCICACVRVRIEGWWWECCVSQFFAMMHCFIILHKGHFTCGMGSLWYRQQLEGESALKNRRGRIYSGKKTDSCVLPWQWLLHMRRANRFDAPAVTLHTLMKYGNYRHMKALVDRDGERVWKKTNKYDFIQRYPLWLILLFINIYFMPFTCYKAAWAISWPRNWRGGKGLLIKNPIVPFQWSTPSAGEHRMEECENKRPPKRALRTLCPAPLKLGRFLLPRSSSSQQQQQQQIFSP